MDPVIIFNHQDIRISVGNHQDKLIYLASDYASLDFKRKIRSELNISHPQIDFGANYQHQKPSELIEKVLESVNERPFDSVGLLFFSEPDIMLRKIENYPFVHGAECLTVNDAVELRKYHNTNVLGFSTENFSLDDPVSAVNLWLRTPFYTDNLDDNILENFMKVIRFRRNIRRSR